MCVITFLLLTYLPFRIVVSRMLTESVDISCVKLIDCTALFRWPIKSVKESISPFHIKKMSSMNRTQITR